MRIQHINNEEGFTLIEVLVSFVILSGAIVLAFQIFADGLRGLRRGETRSRQAAAAQYEVDMLSSAQTIAEGRSEVIVDAVKLRVVVERLKEFDRASSSLLRPFKIRVFANDDMSPTEPLLETIVVMRPAAP